MKRGRIRGGDKLCYHVTHRCHERKFYLRFDIDRKNYVSRLREAKDRFQVDVLDYMITSNHVHILFYSKGVKPVSDAMHFVQGASARDYNRRKGREGAFWSGRFRPTLIQDGVHLCRCMYYISLNMVRARAVLHPSEWSTCGYHELAGARERNLVVNRERLLSCLRNGQVWEEFTKWYRRTVDELAVKGCSGRDALWTESAAVGDIGWIESLADAYNIGRRKAMMVGTGNEANALGVRESPASYGIRISGRRRGGIGLLGA